MTPQEIKQYFIEHGFAEMPDNILLKNNVVIRFKKRVVNVLGWDAFRKREFRLFGAPYKRVFIKDGRIQGIGFNSCKFLRDVL